MKTTLLFTDAVWQDFGGNRLLMTGRHSSRVVSAVIVRRSHGFKFYCKFPATNQFSQICPVLFSNDDGESILQ
jgi:hypothetical protein